MTNATAAAPVRQRPVPPPAAGLPDAAYAAVMLTLPGLWPARAAALLGIARSGRAVEGGRRAGREAWEIVRSGRAGDVPAVRALVREARPEVLAAHWAAAAARVNVASSWAAYQRLGVRVDLLGEGSYPERLAHAPAAPYVLFRRGGARQLEGKTAAIVGTRRASPGGREIAHQFGAGLTAHGVRVVSGLALGIDAAAHEGALTVAGVAGAGGRDQPDGAAARGAPIGVVAGGLDRAYPARHRVLWDRVAAAGVLVSEWPLGAASEGWRFPARNRLIVSLADVVIVVESRQTGGSMITADLALERGVPVLAVPGSIRSPTSAGTNRLLGEGAAPACSVDDVLTALSLSSGGAAGVAAERTLPTGDAATVLAALGWGPVGSDALLARTGLDPPRLAVVLAHLELDGWVAGGPGSWQRVRAADG
ncbi:MAG TPA: DNA-processing protein DprA [Acidimicrobiales bacterium]|nr:DNA-processing protein DprA [Acidimicrobiales bacterium]